MALETIVKLETIVDNLRDGYARLEPGSMYHADQLMAEQVQDASLRNRSFYVADGPLYSLEGEGKTSTLWLTRETDNLVLRHLNHEVDSSYDQLINTGNFHPDPEEARISMNAEGTLRIDLTKLRLRGDEKEWRYLAISTTGYDTLNAEERKLAERFYGLRKAFDGAMETLKNAGISITRVSVLNPSYVQEEAKKGSFGRAAWRNSFNDDANSGANDHFVDSHFGLRGVRRVVAPQGRAPEKGEVPGVAVAPPEITLADCYQRVLADPAQAVRALNDKRVAGLFRIMADYLATRGQ